MKVFGYFGDWEIHEASHVNKALWRTDVATSISLTRVELKNSLKLYVPQGQREHWKIVK